MTDEAKKPRRSALRRQRLILLIAAVVLAVLAVTFGIVHYYTSRIIFNDPGEAGARYFVVKQGGAYLLRDADKNTLPTDENGNFVTRAGTIVSLDRDTGETVVVAVVDTDGSEQLSYDYSTRSYDILMYQKIGLSGSDPALVLSSVTVRNQNDAFTFVRNEQNTFVISGHEATPYSNVMFTTLAVLTGSTAVLDRLPAAAVQQYGYAEYGLPAPGEEGTVSFTVTAMDGTTHTVFVGDEILSGAGYYARNAAGDAVYILKEIAAADGLNASFADVMFGTLEDFVIPTVLPAMTQGSYFDVTDFSVYNAPASIGGSSDLDELEPVITFSYIPIQARQATFAASVPYVGEGRVEGFALNTFNVDDCLQNLYLLDPLRTVRLGRGDLSVLSFAEQYGIGTVLEFVYNAERNGADDGYSPKTQVYCLVWISPQTADGTYYLYNEDYNMVVEVARADLEFLEWSIVDWVELDAFYGNIAFCEELTVEIHDPDLVGAAGRATVNFLLDNSASSGINNKGNIDTSKLTVHAIVNGNTNEPVSVNVSQFRYFYMTLLYSSLIGDARTGSSPIGEAQMEALRASGAEGAAAVVRVTFSTDDGEVTREFCYYPYGAATKLFTTLNGKGTFYSYRSRLLKIIADLDRVFDGGEIDPQAKN